MKLDRSNNLEQWFLSLKKKDLDKFPSKDDYIIRYSFLSEEFYKKIDSYVVLSANSRDNMFLNDHGKEHIKKVIQKASELLISQRCDLEPYEAYILLMAIHIHDIGNILGREGHEYNSIEVISEYKEIAGMDRLEWDCIFEVAEAHGGNPKDKISELVDEKILDLNIRKRLLASILKFADELADDRSRSARFLLQKKNGEGFSLIPEQSEIFHKYSYCLHTVDIDLANKSVMLKFDIEEDDLLRTFKKPKDGGFIETYLLDEIYQRTYKTHLERTYCSRFFRDYISVDIIQVRITITLKEKDERNKYKKIHIDYDLGEIGYPQLDTVMAVCPGLVEYTGEYVKECLTKNVMKDVTIRN